MKAATIKTRNRIRNSYRKIANRIPLLNIRSSRSYDDSPKVRDQKDYTFEQIWETSLGLRDLEDTDHLAYPRA